jgi:hypothetical protein
MALWRVQVQAQSRQGLQAQRPCGLLSGAQRADDASMLWSANIRKHSECARAPGLGPTVGSNARSDMADVNCEPRVEWLRRWKRCGRAGGAHTALAAVPSLSLTASMPSKLQLHARPMCVALSSTCTSRSVPPSASASRCASCDTRSTHAACPLRAPRIGHGRPSHGAGPRVRAEAQTRCEAEGHRVGQV